MKQPGAMWRGPFLVAALVACADDPGAPGSITEPGLARAPAANPEIAYSNDGIWVMNRDGSNQARVTPRGYWLGNGTWAPGGNGTSTSPYRLAYTDACRGIQVVEVTVVAGTPRGGTPTTLLDGSCGREPAWSPLGDEIAYVVDHQLILAPVSGGSPTVIYAPAAPASVGRPTWSPDGLRIAVIEDDDREAIYPVRTIRVITRSGAGQPWSSPVTVYDDGDVTVGGLGSLDWAHTSNRLLLTPSGVLSTVDANGPASQAPVPLTVSRGGRWSPTDDAVALITAGYPARVARFDIATSKTTILANKITCACALAWRR